MKPVIESIETSKLSRYELKQVKELLETCFGESGIEASSLVYRVFDSDPSTKTCIIHPRRLLAADVIFGNNAIYYVCVAKDQTGKKIAQQLVRRTANDILRGMLKKNPYNVSHEHRPRLYVYTDNPPALLTAYSRIGFVPTSYDSKDRTLWMTYYGDISNPCQDLGMDQLLDESIQLDLSNDDEMKKVAKLVCAGQQGYIFDPLRVQRYSKWSSHGIPNPIPLSRGVKETPKRHQHRLKV